MDDLAVNILVAAALLGLLGWALLAWRRMLKRRKRLEKAGQRMTLRFSAGDPFDLPEMHFHLNLFTQGHSRLARNVVHGRLDGLAVRLLDYQYESGTGKNRRTHPWQAALIVTDLRLPGLLCQPHGLRNPLESLFGFKEVPFEAEPFASAFHVSSEDPPFAYRLLHAQMTDLLADHPRLCWETRGDVVAVYHPGLMEPADAADMLRLARRAVELIPAALADELRADAEPDATASN